MGKKMILVIGAASMLFAANCFQAVAAPVTGNIDFSGTATFDTTSLATATQVDIWNNPLVLSSSGDFSSIASGTPVTMAQPWIFNPSTATPSLWSVGGFHFDLLSSVIVTQTASFLNITGAGTISGNGFDATPGDWSFTSTSSRGGNQTSFGFLADTAAVPEPETIRFLLLGAGASFGGVYFRRRSVRR